MTKSNPWVEHVKKVQKEKGITYKQALTEASKTYKKKDPYYGAQEPVPEGRRKATIGEALEAGQVRLYGSTPISVQPKKGKRNN